jgi:hypothetical protein
MAAAFHKDSRRFARGNVRAKHFGIAVGPDRHWVETGNWTATGYNRLSRRLSYTKVAHQKADAENAVWLRCSAKGWQQ